MRKQLTSSLLLLAASHAAGANEPAVEAECDVIATVIEDRPLPDAWEKEMAAKLKAMGFDPDCACVVAPQGKPRDQPEAVVTESNVGTLVTECEPAHRREEICETHFTKAESLATPDGELVHVQLYGSDFNAPRNQNNGE